MYGHFSLIYKDYRLNTISLNQQIQTQQKKENNPINNNKYVSLFGTGTPNNPNLEKASNSIQIKKNTVLGLYNLP